MAKVSKGNAAQHLSVPGMFDATEAEVDGYFIEIESWDVDMDFAFSFKGLPNDQCPASHLGYVVKGRLTVRMADGTEEVFEGGDAYVLKPGHTASVAAGAEFVTFTPIEQAKATKPIVQANMMKYAAEHGIEVPG